MNYNFTRFDGRYIRGDTRIGINKSGLIRLSSGFSKSTSVTNFKYCVFFYDNGNKAIALKFTNKREEGIFRVTKDTTGATVSAKSFFIANKLDPKKFFGRYDWKKQAIPDIGEVFIIKLRNK